MKRIIPGLLFFTSLAYGHPSFELVSRIEQDKITESSGLARSIRNDGVLWTMNDDSEARLYAFDESGRHRGRLTLDPATNRDWEDLASFVFDGRAYLLVADVGDNAARRDSVRLYIVAEPDLAVDDKVRSAPDWTIDVSFPDGPRDVESVAVDITSKQILLLTKRTIPAELYAVPLKPETDTVVASFLGTVESLPQPKKRDLAMARKMNDWWWQPSAMDIRGRHVVIATYRAVFVYERLPDQSWRDALNSPPARISLGGIRDVESVAISTDARFIYVTTEGEAPPLLKSALPWSSVSVMAFNVENLFDTVDDAGKDDKTFLPIEAKQVPAHIDACNDIEVERWRTQCLEWDWSPQTLDTKLARVAAAILQVDGGHGPDIVALQEVENLAILERLRQEFLTEAGYRPGVLIEGQDARGIDVAFLTRLPLNSEPILHPLRFPDSVPKERELDSRGVLQAEFQLPGGGTMTGFSVHFPAPFHPTPMREFAYRHLNALRETVPDDQPVFAAGDFNTTSSENLTENLLGRLVRPHWTIAHEVGCRECPGTSYFAPRKDWSFLDMVLWAPAGGWRLDASSVELPQAAPEQIRLLGNGVAAPRRFDGRGGVSDHLPILVRLKRDP